MHHFQAWVSPTPPQCSDHQLQYCRIFVLICVPTHRQHTPLLFGNMGIDWTQNIPNTTGPSDCVSLSREIIGVTTQYSVWAYLPSQSSVWRWGDCGEFGVRGRLITNQCSADSSRPDSTLQIEMLRIFLQTLDFSNCFAHNKCNKHLNKPKPLYFPLSSFYSSTQCEDFELSLSNKYMEVVFTWIYCHKYPWNYQERALRAAHIHSGIYLIIRQCFK